MMLLELVKKKQQASWIAHKEVVDQRRDERAWERGLTSDEISKAMGYGTGRYCGD